MTVIETSSFSALVKQLAEKLTAKKLIIATAESCTGGWIAQALTSEPGSSAWFDAGLVTYSNESKERLLNVPADFLLFSGPGAVSEQVVTSMTQGVMDNSRANLAIGVSGIAGPEGDALGKPVGTVWIAWQWENKVSTKRFLFNGKRQEIRRAAVEAALLGVIELIS